MNSPKIALLISTFEKPRHLELCLESVARQRDVLDKIEVVVTDDGSTDHTAEIVRQFAARASFPVRMTTHRHEAFQLAICRNEGVAASTAPYLLFLDGDCVLPPDHVAVHLARRRPGWVVAGDCARLSQEASAPLAVDRFDSVEWESLVPDAERRRLRKQYLQACWYRWTRHPRKPKLIGNNIALWRSDYEQINGYDENFVGWGCEDDDLRVRLRRLGRQITSILNQTWTYHVWHPPAPSQPATWKQGENVAYLTRRARLTRCRNGLTKRGDADLRIGLVGRPRDAERWAILSQQLPAPLVPEGESAEVEILVQPGSGRFSRRADYRLLLVLDDCPEAARHVKKADLIVADRPLPMNDRQRRFPIDELKQAIASVV